MTLDEFGFEKFETNAFPIAYLLTFRTYGTWLHGDARGSYQRRRYERMRAVYRDQNIPSNEKMSADLARNPLIFSLEHRKIVEEAIKEVCGQRKFALKALNVRTNHVHVVVSGTIRPERIVNDLKAYATRRLRENGNISADQRVWTRGGSTKYLWKPRHVSAAVDYVLYCQGDVEAETEFSLEEP